MSTAFPTVHELPAPLRDSQTRRRCASVAPFLAVSLLVLLSTALGLVVPLPAFVGRMAVDLIPGGEKSTGSLVASPGSSSTVAITRSQTELASAPSRPAAVVALPRPRKHAAARFRSSAVVTRDAIALSGVGDARGGHVADDTTGDEPGTQKAGAAGGDSGTGDTAGGESSGGSGTTAPTGSPGTTDGGGTSSGGGGSTGDGDANPTAHPGSGGGTGGGDPGGGSSNGGGSGSGSDPGGSSSAGGGGGSGGGAGGSSGGGSTGAGGGGNPPGSPPGQASK